MTGGVEGPVDTVRPERPVGSRRTGTVSRMFRVSANNPRQRTPRRSTYGEPRRSEHRERSAGSGNRNVTHGVSRAVNPRRLLILVPAGASALLACAIGGGPAATRFHSQPDARSTRERRLSLALPFECRSRVVVSQGHGVYSHVRNERFAWDFRTREGTPVLAAAGGVVRLARGDSVRGKCDRALGPEANYVIVSHGDGLETQYLHLSRVFVKAGDRTATGDVIGEVGATGFACGPHLHFQVQRAISAGWANLSVPARFREAGDPAEGQVVVSDNCRREPLADSLERVRASPPAISGK